MNVNEGKPTWSSARRHTRTFLLHGTTKIIIILNYFFKYVDPNFKKYFKHLVDEGMVY